MGQVKDRLRTETGAENVSVSNNGEGGVDVTLRFDDTNVEDALEWSLLAAEREGLTDGN